MPVGCPLLGRVIEYDPAGVRPNVHRCKGGHGYCTVQPSDLRSATGPIQNCVDCTIDVPKLPDLPPPETTSEGVYEVCTNRGRYVRDDTADLCGMKGEIVTLYECDHPKRILPDGSKPHCTERRYCHKQTSIPCCTCNHHSSREAEQPNDDTQ